MNVDHLRESGDELRCEHVHPAEQKQQLRLLAMHQFE
jgi:hypothetical protein